MVKFMAVYNACDGNGKQCCGFVPITATDEAEGYMLAGRVRPGEWHVVDGGMGDIYESWVSELLKNEDESYGSNDPHDYLIIEWMPHERD